MQASGGTQTADEQPRLSTDGPRADGVAKKAGAVRYELAVVMPVYNEEGCVGRVLRAWQEALRALGTNFLIIALNDGSTDGTAAALAPFEKDPNALVVHKANSGHGPTILMGYRTAVQLAQWVFQCDSDDEMPPESFEALWEQRDCYDALLGVRSGRLQTAGRRMLSAASRWTVRLLFGQGVRDVNSPYRLVRASLLKSIVEQVPSDAFAPNVIISGALVRYGARILNSPVPCRPRQTGSASLASWKLLRAAWNSFWQTLQYRPRPVGGASGAKQPGRTRGTSA